MGFLSENPWMWLFDILGANPKMKLGVKAIVAKKQIESFSWMLAANVSAPQFCDILIWDRREYYVT